MPGPVSDSFDPEFGTRENAQLIRSALDGVHQRINELLGNAPPVYILDLLPQTRTVPYTAMLTEKEWRLIRFALERAKESL